MLNLYYYVLYSDRGVPTGAPDIEIVGVSISNEENVPNSSDDVDAGFFDIKER